jgi:uncharacterized membrane protein YfhO
VEHPIDRANYLFRAVWFASGEHEVVFQYRPASFSFGLAASLVSILFFSAVLIFARRAAVRRQPIDQDAGAEAPEGSPR